MSLVERTVIFSMNTGDCVYAAKKNLYDVRRYLTIGEGVNWVPDSLSTAILWAVEAWLSAHGHEKHLCSGWKSIRTKFIDVAPAELKSEVMCCLSKATSLEFDLNGCFEHNEPISSLEEWKKKAYKCLEKTEIVVEKLFKDIDREKIKK